MEDIKMTPEQYFKSIIVKINETKIVEEGYYKNNKIFLIDKRIYLIHELDRNGVALKREFWNIFQYENGECISDEEAQKEIQAWLED